MKTQRGLYVLLLTVVLLIAAVLQTGCADVDTVPVVNASGAEAKPDQPGQVVSSMPQPAIAQPPAAPESADAALARIQRDAYAAGAAPIRLTKTNSGLPDSTAPDGTVILSLGIRKSTDTCLERDPKNGVCSRFARGEPNPCKVPCFQGTR